MMMAFLLINTELGAESAVLAALTLRPHVREAHAVHGVYGIIARVEAASRAQLQQVIRDLRAIDRMRSNISLLVPCHCTRHTRELQARYPDRCEPGCVGKIIRWMPAM